MKKRAFTSLELLIALGVVGVLAAILWPIFVRHRDSNLASSCGSNLNTIGMAFVQYAQDYDEHFPRVTSAKAPPFGWADALLPYVKSAQIFQCPKEGDLNSGTDATKSGYTDFWMNSNASGMALKYFKAPAETVLCGDGNDGVDITDARYHRNSLPQTWRNDQNSPPFRHLGYANYLFADGHYYGLEVEKISQAAKPAFSNFSIH
jgi:prepilin-type processing-associated H-X9-DG protein